MSLESGEYKEDANTHSLSTIPSNEFNPEHVD